MRLLIVVLYFVMFGPTIAGQAVSQENPIILNEMSPIIEIERGQPNGLAGSVFGGPDRDNQSIRFGTAHSENIDLFDTNSTANSIGILEWKTGDTIADYTADLPVALKPADFNDFYREFLVYQENIRTNQLLASWQNDRKGFETELRILLEPLYQYSTNPNETPPSIGPQLNGTADLRTNGETWFSCLDLSDCTGTVENQNTSSTNGGESQKEYSTISCPGLECARNLINKTNPMTLCSQLAIKFFDAKEGCMDQSTYFELMADDNSGHPFYVSVKADTGPRMRGEFQVTLYGRSQKLSGQGSGFECIYANIYYFVGFDGHPERLVDINSIFYGGEESACERKRFLDANKADDVEKGLQENITAAAQLAWVADTESYIVVVEN